MGLNFGTGRMLIDGELIDSDSGMWIDSVNPADETLLGKVPRANKDDGNRAVAAAKAAFPKWAALRPGERAECLRRFAVRLRERADEFLALEVADTGNTARPMRGDIAISSDALEYFAGLVYELKGATIPGAADALHLTIREPFGPVLRITPFNHPVMFAVTKSAAALAAGNTVIVKPSETSPLSTALLGEIARDVFPRGVFNIVSGFGKEVGDDLVRHRDINRIAFTGSVPTGMAIQRSAAEVAVKTISLELGGKNPFIAFPDIDPETIAQAAVAGMNFSWQGQSCGSTSRLLVHEDAYDDVVEAVASRVGSLRIGDPMSDDTEMGPLNSRQQYDRVVSLISMANEDGAQLVCGGSRPKGAEFSRGFWVEPTVFSGVEANMRIAQTEVFGPVLSILRWKDFDDAIRIANSTEYGLTAAVWTNDIHLAIKASRAVESGFVWINAVSAHYPAVPFGGYKNSGIGSEESVDEVLSFTRTKAINLIQRKR